MDSLQSEEHSLRTLRSIKTTLFEIQGSKCPLIIPAGVYVPDAWTRILAQGLLGHLATQPACQLVVEVGVGSGAIPVMLGRLDPTLRPAEYIGLDINQLACEAARLNVRLNGGSLPSRFVAGQHLLEGIPADARGRVEIIAANLPQVPDSGHSAGNRNDYYPPQEHREGLPGRFEQCGIGLLLDLLLTSREVLSPAGVLVLAVAGRCGLSELKALFAFAGMSFRILDRLVVRQDMFTRIECFERIEKECDIRFEFYADETGRQPLTAIDAVRAGQQGIPIYHDLYAIVCASR